MENLVVTPESQLTAGAIVYWRLSGTVRAADLATAWDAADMDTALLPKQVSKQIALGRAIRERAGKHLLVRSCGKGWALVQETEVEDQAGQPILISETLLCAEIENGEPTFRRTPGCALMVFDAHVEAVRAAYDRQQGEMSPDDVSAWIVGLSVEFKGVPLRDTGGIYFIPRTSVDLWRRAVAVLDMVSTHRMFQIPAMRNAEALDAIADAVMAESEAAVAKIEATLGNIGERAMNARLGDCEALLEKITSYDVLLGAQLRCRDRVDALKATIATAIMMQQAEADAAE